MFEEIETFDIHYKKTRHGSWVLIVLIPKVKVDSPLALTITVYVKAYMKNRKMMIGMHFIRVHVQSKVETHIFDLNKKGSWSEEVILPKLTEIYYCLI